MSDEARLADILERLERNEEVVRHGKSEFLASWVLQEATIRNLEVIGEAAKQISSRTRGRYPDVPWKGLAAFRDFAIHQYPKLEPERVWTIASEELPPLRKRLRR